MEALELAQTQEQLSDAQATLEEAFKMIKMIAESPTTSPKDRQGALDFLKQVNYV